MVAKVIGGGGIREAGGWHPAAARANHDCIGDGGQSAASILSPRHAPGHPEPLRSGAEGGAKPRLLDLFCGAGGCAVGYRRAGFEVVGVDLKPQPRYPFEFHQGDALEFLAQHGHEFDAIHASPPCQGYSRLRHLPWLKGRAWPLLIDPLRLALRDLGVPWIIENVEDSPLRGVVLCGQMFGLPVYRHRLFEASFALLSQPHRQHREVIGRGRRVNDRRKGTLNAGSGKGAWGSGGIVTVAGGQFRKADGEKALGIDWMTKDELAQAIPPAYTEFLGRQLLRVVAARGAGR